MPHQCTDCSHVFPDGSKAMLSGCPDCGGNTFQFLPAGAIPDGELDDAETPGPTETDADPEATPADASEAPSTSGRVPVESAESADPAATDDAEAEPVAPPEPHREPPPSRGRLERATDAVRSFVFDSPRTRAPSPSGPEESERAGDLGDKEADAGSRTDPNDPTEPISSSTRNEGGDPTDGSSPPEAPEAGTDAQSADVADSDEERAEADPSAGTGPGGRIDPDDRPDTNSQVDPDIAADHEEEVAADAPDASDAAAEDRPPTAAREDAAGTDESRSSPSDAAPADCRARTPPSGAEDGRIAAEPAEDRPDLEELRRELNDQFESIKIVEPGQYELNLMELYNREEYIIALREDGRYAIEAPETWLGRRADRE